MNHKNFWSAFFLTKKIWGGKFFLTQRNLGRIYFFTRKIWVGNSFDFNKIGSEIIFVTQKNVAWNFLWPKKFGSEFLSVLCWCFVCWSFKKSSILFYKINWFRAFFSVCLRPVFGHGALTNPSPWSISVLARIIICLVKNLGGHKKSASAYKRWGILAHRCSTSITTCKHQLRYIWN